MTTAEVGKTSADSSCLPPEQEHNTMKVTLMREPRQTSGGNPPQLTAGVTLKAVEALEEQDTFTRAQVAYLIHLAYQNGQAHAHRADMAEVEACWDEFAQPKISREQRVQQRLAEMAAGAERKARHPKPHLPPLERGYRTGLDEHGNVVRVGGRVNPDTPWPMVAVVGQPNLQVAA